MSNIIVLNGSHTSGKSIIGKKLQNKGHLYLHELVMDDKTVSAQSNKDYQKILMELENH